MRRNKLCNYVAFFGYKETFFQVFLKCKENMRCNTLNIMQDQSMIFSKPARKILLIASVMLLALLVLMMVIVHARHLADTNSEASVYTPPVMKVGG